ncbi:NKG2-D type II integral membrane protein [Sorex fumeus]|uniref:NKG2-D type II integral membrane protein n=1 Tax=Sorex fumeus TaxID=62283 RepID=UPI0024ADFE45|nr:NKG2-D type II integral membrane protein [Sorex fumeus]
MWKDLNNYVDGTLQMEKDKYCVILLQDISESQDNSLELVKHVSRRQQKRIPTSVTDQCVTNSSPFFLAKAIAVALGIHFIAMVIIGSAMVINSLFNQGAPISLKEKYCGPCPPNWLCYRNNCYQFFYESKSWYQSQASCMSHNATLLKIYNREEQDFLKLVKSYHWMGLRILTNESWQWEDGSILSSDVVTIVEMQNGNCAVYGSNFKGYTENCSTPNTYICMKRTV